MSKPGKVLKGLCKKLGVRLTVKRGKKRVYKSVAVLKRLCKRKAGKKKKKVKKKRKVKRRRRKFGVPSLQSMAAEQIAENMSLDDYKNMLTYPENDPGAKNTIPYFKKKIELELKELVKQRDYSIKRIQKILKIVNVGKTNIISEIARPGAYFFEADLQGAQLRRADLRRANLQDANLREADLQWAHLQNTILNHANLQEADLQGAYLYQSNLYQSHLQGANLKWADLERAHLGQAKLQGVNLTKADLRLADLEGANLQWADLQGAQLQGADLEGADLQGAVLNNAKYDNVTRFPKGFNPHERGMIMVEQPTDITVDLLDFSKMVTKPGGLDFSEFMPPGYKFGRRKRKRVKKKRKRKRRK